MTVGCCNFISTMRIAIFPWVSSAKNIQELMGTGTADMGKLFWGGFRTTEQRSNKAQNKPRNDVRKVERPRRKTRTAGGKQ